MLKLSIIMLIMSCGCTNHKSQWGEHKLKKIIKNDHRSLKNKTRDVYRNLSKTLDFFEVQPDMTVVEVSPGRGWYTEILGPYLKDKGELYMTIFSENSKRSYASKLNKGIKELTTNNNLFGKTYFTVLEAPNEIGPIAPDNSVDRVLTFRNVHNWMKDGKAKEAFTSFYQALRPGGILGVLEHRAKMNKKQDLRSKNGYVREDFVIDLAELVGFKFVSKSEINANYNDDTIHPEGVWTLPPRLKLKDKNRSKYLAIGESDRMTIKFVKPLD